ncbi:MAG: alanine racemase [bacterium]
MKHTSSIELSKSSYKKNLSYLQKRIGKAKFVSVIKGNAYGHGIEQFLPMAESCGVDYFAVFNAYEAERALSAKQPETTIMIMGMIENDELQWAIENGLTFYVFNRERLDSALKYAKKSGRKARIHIEIETGLNRTGFEEYELEYVAELINNNRKFFSVEGICTHYAGAESVANYRRILDQIQCFKRIKRQLKTLNIQAKYYHSACSAAALTYPKTIMNMVRIGIAQYGFWPSKETKMYNILTANKKKMKDPLRRVLKWKSSIMDLKDVSPGEFISYGNSYLTEKRKRIASVPVGYGNGYSRNLSNTGHVLVKGRKAPVMGLINMNMFLIDVTGIKDISIGDEVVLIGRQKSQTITVASFIEYSNHVNYELLTRLPPDIPRTVTS